MEENFFEFEISSQISKNSLDFFKMCSYQNFLEKSSKFCPDSCTQIVVSWKIRLVQNSRIFFRKFIRVQIFLIGLNPGIVRPIVSKSNFLDS